MNKSIVLLLTIFLFNSICFGQLLEKDLTIGTESDKIYFGLIQNIDVNKDGNIYVSDWDTKNIRVFNTKGKLINTIGREGRGPGEFIKIDGSGLSNDGKLYAYDPTLIRVSVFDSGSSTNTLLNTINIPKLENSTQFGSKPRGILAFEQNGEFLLKYITSFSSGTSKLDRKQRYVLFNTDGKIIKQPLLTLPANQWLVKDQAGSISVSSMPFGRKSLLEIGPKDKIYATRTGKLEINIYNKNGSLIKTISDDIKPIPVSDSDFQKANEESSFRLSNFTSEIPDSWPAFDWFEVDDKSRIWVAVNTKDRDSYSLKIYDRQGKKIDQTELSKTIELKEIRNGYVYGIEKGEKGMQSVVRYKINGLNGE